MSGKKSLAVLEISLQRERPLLSRHPAPDFLELFPDALQDPLPVSRSEAASPLPAQERKSKHAHIQEDEEEGDSCGSEPGELPLSSKMKDLTGASRTQKRQITTVLMKAPPRFTAKFEENPVFPVPPLISSSPQVKEVTPVASPQPEEAHTPSDSAPAQRFPLRLVDLDAEMTSDLALERNRVRTLTEEVGRLKADLQRIRIENDRTIAEFRTQKASDLTASYEKQLQSKDTEITQLKSDLESARKEAAIHKQKHDSLTREIQSLNDQQRLLKEDMLIREAVLQGKHRGKTQADRVEREEVDGLRSELERLTEKSAHLELDAAYWQRKATAIRSDDLVTSAKFDEYTREICELRLQVEQLESQNKELASAYRALQRDYSSVLDELSQVRSAPSVRPSPAKPPAQPDTSLLASLRSANVQVLSALVVKQEKMEADRQKLRQALDSLPESSSVQGKGRKHALELELSLVESSLAILSEKVARCRKQA